MVPERQKREMDQRRESRIDSQTHVEETPASGIGDELLALQHHAGNRAIAGLLAAARAKMRVGASDDPAEQEADAVALDVVEALRSARRRPQSAQRKPVQPIARRVQRRAAVGLEGGEIDGETEAALKAATPGGSALPRVTREAMDGAFGTDFSRVRIHTGPDARALNRALGAEAFTVGHDIFFAGRPDFSSPDGEKLLAHELTHTVQQGAAPVARQPDGESPDIGETEAEEGALEDTVEDEEEEDGVEVVKGPDDRKTVRPGPHDKTDVKPPAGAQVLRMSSSSSSSATVDEMDDSQFVAAQKRDAIESAATTDWSNPGGKKVDPFGEESFKPSITGIKWKEDSGKIKVNMKVKAKCAWGVKSGGSKDVKSGSSSVVKLDNYKEIMTDLTPQLDQQSWVPPRQKYWAKALSTRHEKFHSTDDKGWLEGAGKKVATDYLDKQVITLTDDQKKSKSKKKSAINRQVKKAVKDAKKEVGDANWQFYTGGSNSYYAYGGEKRAFGDGKQPYLDLVAAVKKRGEELEAKAKAKADKKNTKKGAAANTPTT